MSTRPIGVTDGEAGFTLAETLIVVALVAMLVLLGTTAFRAGYGQERASQRQLSAELDEARALGAIGGNGATLFVAPAGGGSSVVVYSGRPSTGAPAPIAPDRGNAGLVLPAPVALSVGGNAFEREFAVFVASSGTVSAKQNYSLAQAQQDPLSEEPLCDAASPTFLVIAIAYATPQETRLALSCALAALPQQ